MSMKNRLLATIGGAGLTLAIAVTAVTAGGPVGGSAAPAASHTPVAASNGAGTVTAASTFAMSDFGSFAFGSSGGPGGMAVGLGDPAQCEDVQGKLATNLGVTTDQLEAAIKKTILQEIDEALASGKLTAEQAQTARDRVNSATDLCAGFGMHIGGSGGARPTDRPAIAGGGIHLIDSASYQAVASYFGITTDQLRQDVTDLGSLQAIAAKYSKDTTEGKAGLKAAIETALKADLAKRGLPQEMIDRIAGEFNTNFDTFYTTKLGQGMPFGPGGQSGPGKRQGPRSVPSPSPTTQTN